MNQELPSYAIIVAGGTGNRMKSDLPKQFMLLGKKPLVVYTVQRFFEAIPSIKIIIVVHSEWYGHLQQILRDHCSDKPIEVTTGGATRFHSVLNGIRAINASDGKVAVHDAVRPFVSIEVIRNAMDGASPGIGCVPAIRSRDSIRKVKNGRSEAVEREAYRLVQTPQCFMISDLRAAYDVTFEGRYTDDATVFEASGKQIVLTDGNDENIKITRPIDLRMAGLLLKNNPV